MLQTNLVIVALALNAPAPSPKLTDGVWEYTYGTSVGWMTIKNGTYASRHNFSDTQMTYRGYIWEVSDGLFEVREGNCFTTENFTPYTIKLKNNLEGIQYNPANEFSSPVKVKFIRMSVEEFFKRCGRGNN